MKYIITILLMLTANIAYADLMDDFDSLGGNDVLLEKAESINPEVKVQIVQKRIVDRKFRNEFYPEYGMAFGGDSYLNTSYVGMNYQFHFNPRWSVGVKYSYYFNDLTEEGESLLEDRSGAGADIPELDWPKQSYMAQVNFYPLYGKFNFFNKGIVHFDGYLLLGGGQIE